MNTTIQLTPRQRQVAQLIAESHSTKEIADKLGISPKTVFDHVKELHKKGLKDVAAVTRYALAAGLVTNEFSHTENHA